MRYTDEVEGPGQPKAAGSDLLGPRFLGHLVVQFAVPVHGKGKRSSMDISPSLSSVALSEQHSPSAASLLLSLCAYPYLSQLSFILYPLIYLTGTELSSSCDSQPYPCSSFIILMHIVCLSAAADSADSALHRALQRLFTSELPALCTGNLST